MVTTRVHWHYTKVTLGPAFELFVNQIAMKEGKSHHLIQVKTMAAKQREHRDEDDWTIMRGALAVLLAAALFASGAESQLVDLVALALMLAGVTWLRKVQKKLDTDRENEPSLRGPALKAGGTTVRAQNEPARESHPPDNSAQGSHEGSSGGQNTTARPRAMVKMTRADDDGPPRARPHEPWWRPPFHVPPTGTTDRWQVVENFVVRVHCMQDEVPEVPSNPQLVPTTR